jgi:hypothetical protein
MERIWTPCPPGRNAPSDPGERPESAVIRAAVRCAEARAGRRVIFGQHQTPAASSCRSISTRAFALRRLALPGVAVGGIALFNAPS